MGGIGVVRSGGATAVLVVINCVPEASCLSSQLTVAIGWRDAGSSERDRVRGYWG